MESWKPETDKNKYDEMRELFLQSINKIDFGYFDPEIQKFYDEIKKKYSPEEYERSLLWHLIIGSTPGEHINNFDTPDGDIEDFIRNKLPTIAEAQKE